MSIPISYGFRRPAADRLQIEEWRITSLSGERLDQPDGNVPFWDHTQDLEVSTTIQVDLQGMLADCKLTGAVIAVVLAWHSSRTGLRGVGPPTTLNDGEITMSASLDGSRLGGRLSMELRAILLRPGAAGDLFSPRQAASNLWSSSRIFTLEGSGPRFPVLQVDFASVGVASGRAGAWALVWNTSDPTSSADGAMQLLLNAAHPAVVRYLAEPRVPQHQLLGDVIRLDTARQLLHFALRHEDLEDGLAFEDGTIGHLLMSQTRAWFPERTLVELRSDLQERPGELDAELQARLGVPAP